MTPARAALAAVAALLAGAPAALAAPPPNDDFAGATVLEGPSDVQGTTEESTLAAGEPRDIAGLPATGSVWYEFAAGDARRLVLRLTAAGDLDAGVEIHRRARSQLIAEGAVPTDEQGQAVLVTELRRGATYYIRVVQRENSVPGTFRLQTFLPTGPPRGPGEAMKGTGASGTVDPLAETADAWSAVLRSGVTYRVHLVNRSTRRLGFATFAPGTTNFEQTPAIATERSYRLFTPGPDEGGRYSFLVSARAFDLGDPQPYTLRVAPARPDDLWPGRNLANFDRVTGRIDATGIDVVDTYRFDVADRSAVSVELRPGEDDVIDLALRRANGKKLGVARGGEGEGVDLFRNLGRGRYVVTVRGRRGAKGSYVLHREARALTRLRLRRPAGRIALGDVVRLDLRLRPDEDGRATVSVERFDPATGWHFDRTLPARIVDGRASVSFQPPIEGRWRARAVFAGTRRAQMSETRETLRFQVRTPLDP